MGCDIHAHVEIKLSGKWEHYRQPDIDRDYTLFERMAGVRGEVSEAIAPPRGLPDDITTTTRVCSDYAGSDGHSHSWLSIDEMIDVEAWQRERMKKHGGFASPLFGYLFGNGFEGPKKYPRDCKRMISLGFEDARVVFWFDN